MIKIVEKVKKGRRTCGAIYKSSVGELYLAWIKPQDVYRAGEKSNSDAVRKGTACWGIEYDLLLKMRKRGIVFIGVLIKDTDEVWISTIDKFLNSKVRGFRTTIKYLPLNAECFRTAVI